MEEQEKLRLQQAYEQLADEALLEEVESGEEAFQPGVYPLVLAEAKRRGLEDEIRRREQLRAEQEEASQDMSDMAVVEQFGHRHEAELAQGILEGRGIEASLSADDCGGFRPDIGFVTGGTSLLVRMEDFQRARDILSAVDKNPDGLNE